MIRHVVLFRWTSETSPEAVTAVTDALAELPATIDAIAAYRFGPDAGFGAGNWDYAVTADFHDEAAYAQYRDDPGHQALIKSRILPILAERAAVQVQIDV